jgi:hypothetical protein
MEPGRRFLYNAIADSDFNGGVVFVLFLGKAIGLRVRKLCSTC